MEIKDLTIENLQSGKLETELPEFYELKTVTENNPWHNHESTFEHTLGVLQSLMEILKNEASPGVLRYLEQKVETHTRKELLILAAVFHDLGKKETITWEKDFSFFPTHEQVSVTKAGKLFEKMGLPAKESSLVLSIIENHSEVHLMASSKNPDIDNQFATFKLAHQNYFPELILLVWADTACAYLKETDPEDYSFRINCYKGQLDRL